MASLIEQLTEILEEQATHYELLLGLSREKTEAIIQNDLPELNKITGLENMLISQNQKLEKTRIFVTADIAAVMNMDRDSLTLTGLLERLHDMPVKPRLADVTARVREAVSGLKESNEHNKVLINSSLDYIDFSMNVIQGALGQGPDPYSGADSEINRHCFFDRKQ